MSVRASAPVEAAELLADAAMNALGGAFVDLAVDLATEAVRLAETAGSPPERLAVLRAVRGQVLICAGHVPEGYGLLLEHEAAVDADRSVLAQFMSFGRMIAEDFEGARSRLERFVEQARSSGALEALAYPLGHLADLDLRTGSWARAYARAGEAAQVAELVGQHALHTFGLAWMARIEALTGRVEACQAHLGLVVEATRHCDQALLTYAMLARADHALGHGQPAAALEAYRQLRELHAERGEPDPEITPWLAGLVEALLSLGEREAARAALDEHGPTLSRDGRRWPRALLARLEGLLASDDGPRESAFGEALEWHNGLPMPFERARTELALGTARRRAGRRREARPPLTAALRTFSALGASPWVERARRELAATGERLRTGRTPAPALLSPQELSVANLVAEGRTNVEVAAALFLSPKTIEAHLSRAFRKLGVTNRSQLGRVMRQPVGDGRSLDDQTAG